MNKHVTNTAADGNTRIKNHEMAVIRAQANMNDFGLTLSPIRLRHITASRTPLNEMDAIHEIQFSVAGNGESLDMKTGTAACKKPSLQPCMKLEMRTVWKRESNASVNGIGQP